MPVDHYENFPVASWLLPARFRPPIEAIYAFARGADDIADEGDLSDAARLRGLERYSRALDEIEAGGMPADARFARIAGAVREYALPMPLLRDLIDAFCQDVVKKRYATFAELMDYSRRSANPIGRLLLHLFTAIKGSDTFIRSAMKVSDPFIASDAVCSGLQVVNFWQDVALDWQKGRVYIPQEDLARFGVSEQQIADQRADAPWRALMEFQCERARAMLLAGSPLGRALPGRLGLEIRTTVLGGLAILDKIDAAKGDVFRNRPVLGGWDWTKMVVRAIR